MYISLDIETTGLSNERDSIIEIGAIKFDDHNPIEEFKTFIKFDEPLPPLITHITGIIEKDLENAPALEDVADSLYEFVGDLPIIGHNISFDIDFLEEKGIIFNNPLYDTLQLSSILLPGMPSYSLDMLTKKLKIKHVQKHRALDDSIATAELFKILKGKISDIGPLEEIKSLVERSKWPLKSLFLEAKAAKNAVKKQEGGKEEPTIHTSSLNFNEKEILDFYKEGGPLSEHEEDYEVREPQITMTKKIIDAFENKHHLLCEAGTGTGKSIAYLLPAIFKARSENAKVVIATHTKNLQDQLYKKDIPVLQKALNDGFNASVLKGRRNYLSGERLNKFKQKSFFAGHEITMLIKILIWLEHTKTGDREELPIQRKENFSWNDVCCDAIKCPHNDTEYTSRCFLARARDKAQESDIIITNHALLLGDTIGPTQILPDHRYLIVDEAHHLESEATNALTITLTTEILEHPLKNLKELLKSKPEFSEPIESLLNKMGIFFGILGIFYEKNINYTNSISHLALNDQFFSTLEWERVNDSAQNVILQGEQFYKELHEFVEDSDNEELNKYLQFEMELLAKMMRKMAFVVLEKGVNDFGDNVTWIFRKMDGSLGIQSAPIQVSEHLEGTLFHDKDSIILTSATLTTDHNFNYIRNQLGAGEHFEECMIPSHFSYPDQVEVIIYEDMQPPASPGYFNQTSDIIYKTAKENGGKMLVLFTAKKMIEATYLKLVPLLKEEGITILAQNLSGGRNKIIELFKEDPENSIIFGTNSFWEGIDIKGASLNCVVIQKLPFDPPDDPIHSARGALFEQPFDEYQIPRAILRFKQGFGRLIRSTKDSGKVIILDSRIIKKSYGQTFLNSMPEGVSVKKLNFS